MTPRPPRSPRRSIQLGVLGVVALLIAGRWLAVWFADSAWASSVGVGTSHASIRALQTSLAIFALVSATVWCVGNLYLFYRAIGAVHVPRRVGNIEILEAVPRKYLLVGVVALGLVLAVTISHNADAWWTARALSRVDMTVDLRDPLLGRDAAYYLFRLPWYRTLHSFATVSSAVMLVVVGLLYVAVGAVRRVEKRIQINGLARRHLAMLLAVFAGVLFWGYRLEPVEYVAGLHGVPFDIVLTRVRVPVARLLSAMALIALATSLLWIWIERAAFTVAAWLVLGGASIVGHYIAPAFAAAVRTPDELTSQETQATRPAFEGVAYGLPAAIREAPRGDRPGVAIVLANGPMLDGFAVTLALEQAIPGDSSNRFTEAQLAGFSDTAGRLRPVYLSTRTFDLEVAQRTRTLSWDDVHVGAFASARGVFAVAGDRTAASGMPLFIPDLEHPALVSDTPVPVHLEDPTLRYAPGLRDFAVELPPPPRGRGDGWGIEVGGVLPRLALAWALQSSQMMSRTKVPRGAEILWERDVTARLERYAPFARFGIASPTIVKGVLYWMASGYVSAAGFPGTRAVEWRGDRLRYLRASMIGVVEAASGETSVYVLAEHDPLTRAWTMVVPGVLRPIDDMPAVLQNHVRYPAELLAVQQSLIATGGHPLGSARAGVGLGAINRASVPAWWTGILPTDSVARLRRIAVVDEALGSSATLFMDGTLRDGRLVLEVIDVSRWGGGSQAARLSQWLATRAEANTVFGAVRSVLTLDGLTHLRSQYTTKEGNGVPVFSDVVAWWNGVEASGGTLEEAANGLAALRPVGSRTEPWEEVREWFARLDAARRTGDWQAFGEAYGALQRLLAVPRDTLP